MYNACVQAVYMLGSGEWLLAYQAEQTKYLRAMFASVRNAFQRSLAVSGDGAVSVDIIRKDQKTEPVLDKEFIVSSFGECNFAISFDFTS